MKIAGLVQDSIVDGPGFRFVVFTQGCNLGCEGCHNPATWDPFGGTEIAVEEIVAEMYGNPLTDGITLTGGEPFMQAADCARLASAAREKNLNVWVHTGFTFEELIIKADSDDSVKELLGLTDILVDGRFILAERTLSMKWRGSKNQRVIDVARSVAGGAVVELE